MKIYFFDNNPAKPGEKHGIMGPCHCATASIDYQYQAEMLVAEIFQDHPNVIRAECPDLGMVWNR